MGFRLAGASISIVDDKAHVFVVMMWRDIVVVTVAHDALSSVTKLLICHDWPGAGVSGDGFKTVEGWSIPVLKENVALLEPGLMIVIWLSVLHANYAWSQVTLKNKFLTVLRALYNSKVFF